MPKKKSVALIGAGEGPEVVIAAHPARVQVRGIRAEEYALIVQKFNELEDVVISAAKDGIHELIDCASVRVIYEGKNRGFIACVTMGG